MTKITWKGSARVSLTVSHRETARVDELVKTAEHELEGFTLERGAGYWQGAEEARATVALVGVDVAALRLELERLAEHAYLLGFSCLQYEEHAASYRVEEWQHAEPLTPASEDGRAISELELDLAFSGQGELSPLYAIASRAAGAEYPGDPMTDDVAAFAVEEFANGSTYIGDEHRTVGHLRAIARSLGRRQRENLLYELGQYGEGS